MRPQPRTTLGNRDIKPTNHPSLETQDGNWVFQVGPDYGTGNHCVHKQNRGAQ